MRIIDLLTLVLAVAITDSCLYWELGGAGYALAIIGWTLLFWVTAPARHFHPVVLLAVGLNLLLAAGCAWNVGFWSAVAPLAWLFAFAIITRSRHTHMLDSLFVGTLAAFLGPFRLLGHGIFVATGLRRRRSDLAHGAARYTIPTVVAVFLVLLFGWIFSEANPVISYWVGWFFEKLWNILEEILPDIPRLFLWGFSACLAAGLIKPFLADLPFFPREDQDEPKPATPFVETAALTALFALVASVVVFLLFNILDAVYLWGKAALPEGITYSQYARRGTGWLTFALFLSTLLIGAASAQALRADRRLRTILGLSWAWIALDLLLAVGVLRRIQLYVGYNGLTPLRMTGIFGVLIVSAGLLAMGWKLQRHKNMPWIIRRYAVIFLAGVSVYAVIPEETISAGYNTRVAMAGNPAPLVWMFEEHTWEGRRRVDAEGLPELLPLLDHPDTVIARGVSAYLVEERDRLNSRTMDDGWRSWQGSYARAHTALSEAAPRLTADTTALDLFRERVSAYR